MVKIHNLARPHLKRIKTLTGMPSKSESPQLTHLHLNLNFFSDSNYIRYPEDHNETLCELFLQFLKKEAIWKNYDPSYLLTSNNLIFLSSSQGIDLIIKAFCDPERDLVGISSPTFPLYSFLAQSYNVTVVDIPLKGKNLDQIDLDKIIHSKIKVLFIPNPNNPIGNLVRRSCLLKLINHFQGLIVIDEAYIEFSDNDSFTRFTFEYPNLVVLRSFSKIWGYAGIRSGVVVGSENLIHTLKLVISPCFFSTPTQKILENILIEPYKILEMKQKALLERQFLIKNLQQLSQVSYIYHSESNFILVKFHDSDAVYSALLKNGIIVRNFHPQISNALRISLGTREDNKKIIEIIKKIEEQSYPKENKRS